MKTREILSFACANLFNGDDCGRSLSGLDSCLDSERGSVIVPRLSSNFGLTYALGSPEALNDCCLCTECRLTDMSAYGLAFSERAPKAAVEDAT